LIIAIIAFIFKNNNAQVPRLNINYQETMMKSAKPLFVVTDETVRKKSIGKPTRNNSIV
jgi:hypothetical protein